MHGVYPTMHFCFVFVFVVYLVSWPVLVFSCWQHCSYPDLLATTGDYLRLWRVQEDGETKQECFLNNVCLITERIHSIL